MKKSTPLWLLVFLSLITCNLVHATSTKNVFKKYLNKYFVETGTYAGDSVQHAAESGFSIIFSIELSPKYYKVAKERFVDEEKIHIFLGDSAKILGQVIGGIREPITFWLDGHCSMKDTALGDTMTP